MVNSNDQKTITAGNEICKYVNDIYPIIPAINVVSRGAELNNIKESARANHLTLSLSNTKELIFVDSKRQRQFHPPSLIPELTRVSPLRILCVTATRNMFATEYVNAVA